MANFYAKVKQTIKECDIVYNEPLSYMKHFMLNHEDDNKVVVFCNRVSCLRNKQFFRWLFKLNFIEISKRYHQIGQLRLPNLNQK